jgi:hypothetical protein
MERKNEGICRFCLKTFSGAAMSRHLVACKAKKEKDEQEMAKAKTKYPIYYLKLSGYRDYWLHVEMKAASTLRELDDFLRRIWLECCGHLSMFTINNVEYEDTEEQGDFDDFWGRPAASIDTSLVKALNVGDKFDYEYDFGTTTYVEGKVIAARQGVLSEPVRILARNNPYIFGCDECDQQATDYCTECQAFLCEGCLTDPDIHECGEEMALPIVNSPRMGECGYTGEYDFDDFSIPEPNA